MTTRQSMIWLWVIAAGAVLLALSMVMNRGLVGRVYVRELDKQFVQVQRPVADDKGQVVDHEKAWVLATSPQVNEPGVKVLSTSPVKRVTTEAATVRDYKTGEAGVKLSVWRTLGTWFGAFLTLCIFSFLYRDNPFYKFAESVFVGVSAAYWMVVGFWNVIVPNLIGNLFPFFVKDWAMPGLEATSGKYVYIVPLILGAMLLWRLMPSGGWVSRWPLAFFIGVFAGLRMIQFIHADFLNQIKNGILPLVAKSDQGILWGTSIWNIISVFGTLACLTYFFFSIEHKGAVGRFARVGTWILMITFGAMFGYTVMGRIALLTGRLEFLFIDWMWLIDPTGTRAAG
jgi:hypothetical protein